MSCSIQEGQLRVPFLLDSTDSEADSESEAFHAPIQATFAGGQRLYSCIAPLSGRCQEVRISIADCREKQAEAEEVKPLEVVNESKQETFPIPLALLEDNEQADGKIITTALIAFVGVACLNVAPLVGPVLMGGWGLHLVLHRCCPAYEHASDAMITKIKDRIFSESPEFASIKAETE